jgi:hypothetical protein
MAAVDFPASPALNQVFTASTGAVYKWDGTLWLPVGIAGSQIALADTPPASPTPGQLWWNSVLGQLFIWFNDGTSSQWVPATPVPAPLIVTPPIGSMIQGSFGAGGIPANVWTEGIGWSVAFNDTGVAPVGNRWTAPAGRWIVLCNMQCAAPAGQNVGGAIGLNNAFTGYQSIGASGGGSSGYVGICINATLDFNGTTPLSFALFTQAGPSNLTAQSWWSATRIK